MSKFSLDEYDSQNSILTFHCPGCKIDHQVYFGCRKKPSWIWNNDIQKPTITPSILVTTGHHSSPGVENNGCWCTFNGLDSPYSGKFKCFRCHSFITDGKIQFLSDCTHELANQTVELPDYIE